MLEEVGASQDIRRCHCANVAVGEGGGDTLYMASLL